MTFDLPSTPSGYLRRRLPMLPGLERLEAYDAWWAAQGRGISAAIDRQGTPWLRMFDALGRRVDEVLFPPGYRALLLRGYQAGVVWRVFDKTAPAGAGLAEAYLLGNYADAAVRQLNEANSMIADAESKKMGVDAQLKAKIEQAMARAVASIEMGPWVMERLWKSFFGG